MICRRSAVTVALLVVGAGLASARPAAAAPTCVTPPLTSAVAPAATAGGFTAIDPVRVLDTRNGGDPGDPGDRLGSGCTTIVTVPDAAAPAGAAAVALTVTAVGATSAGYVTVFPCSSARPLASNLNPRPGEIVSNLVVVGLGTDRRVCAFASQATHLVIDATGWFGPEGDPFHPLDGARLLDSRLASDRGTGPDGRQAGGDVRRLTVTGANGVPTAATAVAVNLTVVDGVTDGYAVAYPCAATRPSTSTVPVRLGAARAGQTYVGLAPGGELCVLTSVAAHVIVDLVGWFGPDGTGPVGQPLVTRSPVRVVDTRQPGALLPATTPWVPFRLDLGATGALAPNTTAAVLDVVATGADAAGWVVFHPCGRPLPATSSVNVVPGADAANVVTVAIADDGAVCGLASSALHLVVDVLGSFAAPTALVSLRTGDVPLSPRFDPLGLDYDVRCPSSGALDLPVSAVGAPGTTVTVEGLRGGTASTVGRVTNAAGALETDDLVTVTVRRGATVVATYAVRCLPADFPLVRTRTRTTPTPGWYLMSNTFGPASTRYAWVLDDRGAVVWYRRTSTPVADVKRLPDGTIAWAPVLAANQGFGVDPTSVYVEQALDGTQVRSYGAPSAPTDYHDLVALPNGNVLVLTYERERGVALPGAPACQNASRDVYWSNVQELTTTGDVVWTWRSRDHLTAADTTYLPKGGIDGCDLQHADALDVTSDGDVIVTMRNLDTVLRIRRAPGTPDDGKIVWRLGGAATSFLFLDDPYAGPARPHDARLSADGTTLSLVDNRTERAGETARVAVYTLDPAARTARLTWSAPFVAPVNGETWSAGSGSARRTADGHLVVGWGDQTTPQLTEYDPAGNPVLEVETPDSWGYRVVKEPVASFDRATLRATAGSTAP